MTTEELIEHLNTENRISDDINAGLRMGADSKKYVVIYTPDDVEMLAVPTNATNWLNVHYNWYESGDDISAPAREVISSLISQYLNTPVSKRESEKEYRLRWLDCNDFNIDRATYLGLHIGNDNVSYWRTCGKASATVFNEERLENMKCDHPRFASAIDAMKEEVKDDAC